MQLLLTRPIIRRLTHELRKAGRREIGGLLMGEHVRDAVFRVVNLTVQHSGGTAACFKRLPDEHQAELARFFERTGDDYTRFNYLGEWHSHPSFAPVPSQTDLETMQSIASDPSVGVNFAILLILKLDGRRRLHVSASAFRPGVPAETVTIELEHDESPTPFTTALRWVKQVLRV